MNKMLNLTCVCETRMLLAATKSKYVKLCESYKCEQPLDELTVQVW